MPYLCDNESNENRKHCKMITLLPKIIGRLRDCKTLNIIIFIAQYKFMLFFRYCTSYVSVSLTIKTIACSLHLLTFF